MEVRPLELILGHSQPRIGQRVARRAEILEGGCISRAGKALLDNCKPIGKAFESRRSVGQ